MARTSFQSTLTKSILVVLCKTWHFTLRAGKHTGKMMLSSLMTMARYRWELGKDRVRNTLLKNK